VDRSYQSSPAARIVRELNLCKDILGEFHWRAERHTLFDVDIGPSEIMIILVLVLVVFGGSQLPKLARNLGKAQQEFKSALANADKDDDDADTGDKNKPEPQPVQSDSE
jgi:sec-independent protein translocase protein TatA